MTNYNKNEFFIDRKISFNVKCDNCKQDIYITSLEYPDSVTYKLQVNVQNHYCMKQHKETGL
jgi:hypothetical protein